MSLTPLHTRMISLRLNWGDSGRLVAHGRIFDLRKRGVVPLAGKLQGPGVVHDMAVEIQLDYSDLRIAAITPSMSAFPFAPSPATRGEGCPDRLPDVQHLIGKSLRDNYGSTLMETVGGPRGCFHIFTLLRLIGPTIAAVVEWEQTRRPPIPTIPTPGSPLFARSVVVDGMKGEGISIVLRGMLFDLHYPPGADALPLEEEMEASVEAAADLVVGVPSMEITSGSGRVRRSGSGIEALGSWEGVATVERLVGLSMMKGYTGRVQELFAATTDLGPLQHLLFMMAPTLMQCFPSLAEELELRPRRAEGPHAAVNSCHMWRAEGPLVAAGIGR
jgi:Protein of unknown function (DUF2889)